MCWFALYQVTSDDASELEVIKNWPCMLADYAINLHMLQHGKKKKSICSESHVWIYCSLILEIIDWSL